MTPTNSDTHVGLITALRKAWLAARDANDQEAAEVLAALGRSVKERAEQDHIAPVLPLGDGEQAS